MKKILLVLLFVICFKTYGQLDYTFADTTATYTELTSPTVVSSAWTQTFEMKMPFQFTYFKKQFDTLRITPNSVSFTKYLSDFISMGQEDYYYGGVLYPAGSEISYLVTGSTPNRIIKAQYKNLRAVTTDTTEEYYVNNQIWLYEKSNKIEFHFGPNLNTDINITTYYFGFRDSDGSPYLAMSGSAGSPAFAQVMNVGTFKGMSAHPVNGTVYIYTPYVPPTTSLSKIAKPYTFTNSDKSFSISSGGVSNVLISDLSGRKISEVLLNADSKFQYDYSALSSGIYLVTINANNQLFTEKIIVQ